MLSTPRELVATLLGTEYEVKGTLSRCLFGSILDGCHVPSGTPVAIKVIRTARPARPVRLPGRLGRAQESHEEERKMMELLSEHPNPCLVSTLDLTASAAGGGSDAASPDVAPPAASSHVAWVLPRARCDALSMLQAEGAADTSLTRERFAGLVAAVAHLHAMNRCHRDISAENILVFDLNEEETASNGGDPIRLALADYGLSIDVPEPEADGSRGLVRDGFVAGKPGYLAPEMLDGTPYDPIAADVYSLGVVLFALLTGSAMYTSPSAADRAFACVRRGQIPQLVKHWRLDARFSSAALEVLVAMMSIDPAARPSAEDVLNSEYLRETRAARRWRSETAVVACVEATGAAAESAAVCEGHAAAIETQSIDVGEIKHDGRVSEPSAAVKATSCGADQMDAASVTDVSFEDTPNDCCDTSADADDMRDCDSHNLISTLSGTSSARSESASRRTSSSLVSPVRLDGATVNLEDGAESCSGVMMPDASEDVELEASSYSDRGGSPAWTKADGNQSHRGCANGFLTRGPAGMGQSEPDRAADAESSAFTAVHYESP